MTEDLVRRLEKPAARRHLAHYFDERINLLAITDPNRLNEIDIALVKIKRFLENPRKAMEKLM